MKIDADWARGHVFKDIDHDNTRIGIPINRDLQGKRERMEFVTETIATSSSVHILDGGGARSTLDRTRTSE